jgi:hypothetical protein
MPPKATHGEKGALNKRVQTKNRKISLGQRLRMAYCKDARSEGNLDNGSETACLTPQKKKR